MLQISRRLHDTHNTPFHDINMSEGVIGTINHWYSVRLYKLMNFHLNQEGFQERLGSVMTLVLQIVASG